MKDARSPLSAGRASRCSRAFSPPRRPWARLQRASRASLPSSGRPPRRSRLAPPGGARQACRAAPAPARRPAPGRSRSATSPAGPPRAASARPPSSARRSVLGVAAQRGDWLGVVTSARPNGELGWVRRDAAVAVRAARAGRCTRTSPSARSRCAATAARSTALTVAIGRPGSETPTGRFAVTDKLAGSQLRPLLRLLHPGPQRPPAQHAARLDRRQPAGDPRHRRARPRSARPPRRAACAPPTPTSQVLMAQVPLGTPVFIRRSAPFPALQAGYRERRPKEGDMVGILIAVLVAVLVYMILAALTLLDRRDRRRDPRADRRHPDRRIRLRQPLRRPSLGRLTLTEPEVGLEPTACALQERCSTN